MGLFVDTDTDTDGDRDGDRDRDDMGDRFIAEF